MAHGIRRPSKRGSKFSSSESFGPDFGGVVGVPLAKPGAKSDAVVSEDVMKLFQLLDTDGNGMIDREELASVLSLLGAYWTSRRIRNLFRAADVDRDQLISIAEFCNWIFSSGHDQQVLMSALPELQARKAAEQEALEAAAAAEQERRSSHEASLVAARTVVSLTAALEAAESVFSAEELQEHRQRLETMRLPYVITVTSLAGGTFEIEATREQTVTSLCQELARRLDKKAYRLTLVHEGGRVEPPSATLEECGVTGPMELAVQFGEADPILEMSLPEFLELLVEHNLTTKAQADEIQKSCHEGSTNEDDCRIKYKVELSAKISEKEARLKREEAARRKREEEEERRRKAEAERRSLRLALHRSRLESLPPEELLPEAAVPALPEGGRDGLLQQLAFKRAVDACIAEVVALKDAMDAQEAVCCELAGEAQSIKEEAQGKLDLCLPEMFNALSALDRLRLSDIVECRSMNWRSMHSRALRPLAETLRGLAILFQIRPQRPADPNDPTKQIDDYVRPVFSQLMHDNNILHRLKDFDKDNIPDRVISRLTSYVDDESCTPEALRKISVFGEAICRWVRSMYAYHHVAVEVEPLRVALRIKESELDQAMAVLKAQRDEHIPLAEDLQYFQEELRILLQSTGASGES
eukprot:TRINITY_DN28033_c0_g1_i1.p1 TRINITY_DN28033_c0_g1~~TRINITY_DN28033_c0_g1_i1.p1  ORF type:complete len:642 (+),score=114.95 TRINITY_DN28033_c0_g1_i1:70-1995(+)